MGMLESVSNIPRKFGRRGWQSCLISLMSRWVLWLAEVLHGCVLDVPALYTRHQDDYGGTAWKTFSMQLVHYSTFFKKNLLCFHFPLNKEWEYKAGSLWKIQFRGSFLNSYKTFHIELLHYYLSPKFHFCYTRRSIMHVYTFQFLTQNPADWPTDSRCLINIYHQWQHCKHPDTLLLK